MGGTCVVSCVVEPLPLPVGKVAGIDLKETDASLTSDSYAVSFPDINAAAAIRSSCVVKRKRIETTLKSGDVDGIFPFTFWPKFLYRNPQFQRTIFWLIYHGTFSHAELEGDAGAAAPAFLSPSRSAPVCNRACNEPAQDAQVVRAYSRSGCFGG